MVQKYTAPVRVFKHPFELVMAAYERRFPTCHLIPVFVGSDKIFENISDDGSIHVIERRCRINVDAPYILRKITGVDQVLFIQKNTLNKKERVLKIEAKNESFSNLININELCYYRVSPENENWTIFEQQASLEINSFWGFDNLVEKIAVKHYSQSIKKGEEVIHYHINELKEEGIYFIPRFDTNSDPDYCDDNGNEFISSDNSFFHRSNEICPDNLDRQITNNNISNGTITMSKDDSVKSTTNETQDKQRNCTKNNFRSNSMEEKLQATKNKILNKCESLTNKKKSSFETNNGIKSGSNNNTSNTISLS